MYAQKAATKNRQRISNNNANNLVKVTYQNTNIGECFDNTGMTNLFLNNINVDNHNKVFQRLSDNYLQQSQSHISIPVSKLWTYNLIKKDNGMEPYLIKIKNFNYRKSLTKFRPSNYDLMIEAGRYRKTKGFCPFCIASVTDEIHFLINCSTYNNARREVLNDCIKLKPKFSYYTDPEQFIFLLTNEKIFFKL